MLRVDLNSSCLRPRSQIIRGGLQNGRGGGGAGEVLPLQKRGSDKVLAILKGGGTHSFEVVSTRELEVLVIVTGKFPMEKGDKKITLS